jgi:hypothetical protein
MLIKTNQQIAYSFVRTLPGVVGAYGFGSGLLDQIGPGAKKGQLDLIVVVKDTTLFHIKNIQLNPNYYTKKEIKSFSKKRIIQSFGTDVCYLTYIKYEDKDIKVGFVEEEKFIDDNLNYSKGFLPGRFQKPIHSFISNKELDESITINRQNGLLVALKLIDSDKTNLFELYRMITRLSYYGDIRTVFQYENPNKVENLIAGNISKYNDIYLNSNINDNFFSVNNSSLNTIEDLKKTEVTINQELVNQFINDHKPGIFQYMKGLIEKEKIEKHIYNKNLRVSSMHVIKSIFMTDISKLLKYLEEKRLKGKVKKLSIN